MKCEQLIGTPDNPRRCSVPATYTMQDMGGPSEETMPLKDRHFCVLHARKNAAMMPRDMFVMVRDADGKRI